MCVCVCVCYPLSPTHVSEDQARESLLQLSSQNFCWGNKAARDSVISSITSSSAYHVCNSEHSILMYVLVNTVY